MVQVSVVSIDTDVKVRLYAISVQEKVGSPVLDSKSCVLIATNQEITTEEFLAMENVASVMERASVNLVAVTDINNYLKR